MTRPTRNVRLLFVVILVLFFATRGAATQQTSVTDRTDALRVFLDCDACDEPYLRTDVSFINYVRDRAVAELHVLVTTQDTGSGATEYTVQFIGLRRFAGVQQTLAYVAPPTNTPDETRRGFAAVFRLGLVRYVAETPLASRLGITFNQAADSEAGAVRDPWRFWIFNLGVNGNVQGQETQSEKNVEGSFTANRTTDDWKVELGVEYDCSRETFTLDEGEIFTAVQRELDAEALVAKSLTSHWSVGLAAAVLSSTFNNYDLRTRIEFGFGISYTFGSIFNNVRQPKVQERPRLLRRGRTASTHIRSPRVTSG